MFQIVAQGQIPLLEETKLSLGIEESISTTITLKKSQILIPGLIDTHIHAVQFPNCGVGYDVTLLEWLEKYTYKLEKCYRDLGFAKSVFSEVVVSRLRQYLPILN